MIDNLGLFRTNKLKNRSSIARFDFNFEHSRLMNEFRMRHSDEDRKEQSPAIHRCRHTPARGMYGDQFRTSTHNAIVPKPGDSAEGCAARLLATVHRPPGP